MSRTEAGGTGYATALNADDNVGSDRPCVVPRKPRTALVSGPLEPSSTCFTTHYAPRILSANSAGDCFVFGPSCGIGSFALDFLLSQNVTRSRIHFYMFESEARNKKGRIEALKKVGIHVCVRGKIHTQRDVAMTKESDYDILKYLTREERMKLYGDRYRERVSGTELNEQRRAAMERELGADEPMLVSYLGSVRGASRPILFEGMVLFSGIRRVRRRTLLLDVLIDQDKQSDISLSSTERLLLVVHAIMKPSTNFLQECKKMVHYICQPMGWANHPP